jgi:hypothetical protein
MAAKLKEPPKTIRERTSRLLKMAGSIASQELLRRLQSKNGTELPLNLAQIQTLVKELAHLTSIGQVQRASLPSGQALAIKVQYPGIFGESEYPEKMRNISRELVKALRFSAPPQKLIFLHRKLSGVFYILRTLNVKLPLRGYTERFEALALS